MYPRNSAFDLLEMMIKFPRTAGYKFEFMSGLCDYLETDSLPKFPLGKAIKYGSSLRSHQRGRDG